MVRLLYILINSESIQYSFIEISVVSAVAKNILAKSGEDVSSMVKENAAIPMVAEFSF